MTSAPQYTAASPTDFVLPFDLRHAGVRGRLVRLSESAARALSAHRLPESAGRIAAETVALATLLGTALKLDGRLTVQTKSNGPLDLVTADYYGAAPGHEKGVRGFARIDEARLAALPPAPDFAALAGEGVMAITIEPKRGAQTYQGIVALSLKGIAASAEAYFAQSEQLPTLVRLAAAPAYTPGNPHAEWRAGALMLQAVPDAARDTDDWERLWLLARTVEDIELLDAALAPETLLWRLFHEDEVHVLPPETIAFRCDCDGGRIASVLRAYSDAERAGLADPDGIIRARCEFCGKTHEIVPAAL